ncbi:MAG: HAD-IA family hydrolase [Candidatus Roizmanbacteria bacterium]|nr:HAD-IA family hydrolase [Candidatus Roizmanbacteria bacterium]
MKNIKWILCDVGGVIIKFTFTNPEGYMVGTRHFDPKELEGVYSEKDYTHYMLGELSHEQFIGRYLKKHKLDLSVDEFNEAFIQDITPNQGMKELFEKLEKKYKIALVPNEGKVLTKYRIEGSGLLPYLSKVIPSYLLREIKPSTQFFKKALAIIDAKPDECIFIDDTKANCDAASSFGIKILQFENVKQLEEELHRLEII